MKEFIQASRNEEGFVLILAMMIMLVLTLLGIAANRNTSTELMISGNDSLQRQTFYQADGGTEVGSEVLEQNIFCVSGFTANDGTDAVMEGMIRVLDNPADPTPLNFWQNVNPASLPSDDDTVRDFYYPANYAASDPHTNFTVGGQTKLTAGAALQMAAGYEGKGKGIGSGGAHLLYDIYAQRLNVRNAEAVIRVQWRHTIGMEDECKY